VTYARDSRHRLETSSPAVLTLGRWRAIRATLARIPLLGRLFGSYELALTPSYLVQTQSGKNGYVDVEGKFQEGFFQADSLAKIGCSPVKAANPGQRAVQCSINQGTDGLKLPPGWYGLTLKRDGCNKALPHFEVKPGSNESIDFDKLCPP